MLNHPTIDNSPIDQLFKEAKLKLDEKDYKNARVLGEALIGFTKNSSSILQQARAYNILGKAYAGLGTREEAEFNFKQAKELFLPSKPKPIQTYSQPVPGATSCNLDTTSTLALLAEGLSKKNVDDKNPLTSSTENPLQPQEEMLFLSYSLAQKYYDECIYYVDLALKMDNRQERDDLISATLTHCNKARLAPNEDMKLKSNLYQLSSLLHKILSKTISDEHFKKAIFYGKYAIIYAPSAELKDIARSCFFEKILGQEIPPPGSALEKICDIDLVEPPPDSPLAAIEHKPLPPFPPSLARDFPCVSDPFLKLPDNINSGYSEIDLLYHQAFNFYESKNYTEAAIYFGTTRLLLQHKPSMHKPSLLTAYLYQILCIKLNAVNLPNDEKNTPRRVLLLKSAYTLCNEALILAIELSSDSAQCSLYLNRAFLQRHMIIDKSHEFSSSLNLAVQDCRNAIRVAGTNTYLKEEAEKFLYIAILNLPDLPGEGSEFRQLSNLENKVKLTFKAPFLALPSPKKDRLEKILKFSEAHINLLNKKNQPEEALEECKETLALIKEKANNKLAKKWNEIINHLKSSIESDLVKKTVGSLQDANKGLREALQLKKDFIKIYKQLQAKKSQLTNHKNLGEIKKEVVKNKRNLLKLLKNMQKKCEQGKISLDKIKKAFNQNKNLSVKSVRRIKALMDTASLAITDLESFLQVDQISIVNTAAQEVLSFAAEQHSVLRPKAAGPGPEEEMVAVVTSTSVERTASPIPHEEEEAPPSEGPSLSLPEDKTPEKTEMSLPTLAKQISSLTLDKIEASSTIFTEAPPPTADQDKEEALNLPAEDNDSMHATLEEGPTAILPPINEEILSKVRGLNADLSTHPDLKRYGLFVVMRGTAVLKYLMAELKIEVAIDAKDCDLFIYGAPTPQILPVYNGFNGKLITSINRNNAQIAADNYCLTALLITAGFVLLNGAFLFDNYKNYDKNIELTVCRQGYYSYNHYHFTSQNLYFGADGQTLLYDHVHGQWQTVAQCGLKRDLDNRLFEIELPEPVRSGSAKEAKGFFTRLIKYCEKLKPVHEFRFGKNFNLALSADWQEKYFIASLFLSLKKETPVNKRPIYLEMISIIKNKQFTSENMLANQIIYVFCKAVAKSQDVILSPPLLTRIVQVLQEHYHVPGTSGENFYFDLHTLINQAVHFQPLTLTKTFSLPAKAVQTISTSQEIEQKARPTGFSTLVGKPSLFFNGRPLLPGESPTLLTNRQLFFGTPGNQPPKSTFAAKKNLKPAKFTSCS